MTRGLRPVAVLATLVLTAVPACSGDSGSRAGPPSTTNAPALVPEPGTLRAVGAARSVRVGAAVDADALGSDPAYASAVTRHFGSVTPENAMKWTVTRPGPDQWDWADADAVVEFAEANDLEVRGHALVWGQAAGNGVPAWLQELEDPQAFATAFADGITTEVGRYRGRVDRWDVVNEPLTAIEGEIDENLFFQRIGPDYIARAFALAEAADPDAELWLNEVGTEYLPAKADALVALVTDLVADGVPIDGVGFQTHLTVDLPIAPGAVSSVMEQITALGLDVAITELDVPIGPGRGPRRQAALYRQVASECRAVGCDEVTVWGVDDGRTWLDDDEAREANPFLAAFPAPTRPLLLDDGYTPKATYDAVAEGLGGG